MIATILPSGSTFFAVAYNEKKVQKGQAQLLEIKNFPLAVMRHPSADDMRKYLVAYSARNNRIQNPQFHVAISCRGHEQTETQLLDFAHKWLAEMGYAGPGQPLLIYAHRDTENTHIHIVTSRVDSMGKKIDHSHERRRSQAAIDKILGQDVKQEVDSIVSEAMTYNFNSQGQFQAVLEALGAECYVHDDVMKIKRGGVVQADLPLADITARRKPEAPDKDYLKKLQAIVRRYQAQCGSKSELQAELKNKFGLSLVFLGRADSPYGYMIVDHGNKTVTNGSQVVKIKELLDFMTPQERFDRIDMTIQMELTQNPMTTTADINRLLRRQFHVFLRNGSVTFNGATMPVNPGLVQQLKYNDKVAWVQKFNPTTQDECDLLSGIFNLGSLSPLRPGSPGINTVASLNTITGIFNGGGSGPNSGGGVAGSIGGALNSAGISIVNHNGNVYAIDYTNKAIVNLTAYGFNTALLAAPVIQQLPQQPQRHPGHHSADIYGRSEKREWEIRHGADDGVDTDSQLKL